jgi:tetratricopeptide (TPR) repeat protein
MSKSLENDFQKIRNYLSITNYVEAKKVLTKTLKKGALSDLDKITVVSFYYQMGDMGKAMKIAGQEASYEEMLAMEEVELGLQVEVARIQNFSGARYSASRIVEKFENVLKERKLDVKKVNIRFPLFRAIMSRIEGRGLVAVEHALKAMEFYPKNNSDFYNSWLNAIDCLVNGNDRKLYEQIFNEYAEQAAKYKMYYAGVIKRHLSNRAVIDGEFEKALALAEESVQAFVSAPESVEFAVSLRSKGEALSHLGRKAEALECLKKSFELVHEGKHSPSMGVKCLWEMYHINPDSLTFAEKVTLHCHPCFSTFSFFVGKLFDSKKFGDHNSYFKDFKPNVDRETWYIENEKIIPVKYQDKIREVYQSWIKSPRDIFDCVAGVLWSKTGKVEVLPEVQLRTLIALWSSGFLGLNRWAIIDFIYREEPISFKYGEERLKATLSQLKKFKFQVKRKENFFYSDLPENAEVFLPMEVSSASPWRAFQAFYPETFSRQDLENFFGIHKATANRWINDWIDQNRIERQGTELQFKKIG